MLFIAIVIYNKKSEDIASKKAIQKLREQYDLDHVRVIIVDNSDRNIKSENEFVSNEGIAYIKNNKNLGLSKAYNKAVNYAKHISKDLTNDFILFLDDDTEVPYEYLDKIYKTAEIEAHSSNHINIITGMVTSGTGPMSPTKGYRFRYKASDYITKPGIYEDITFINSGTAIRLDSILKVNGFNEELFLDMIDYTMAYELMRHGLCRVNVINYKITQSFSGRTKVDKRVLIRRYHIYKKDFEKYCEITGISKMFCRMALLKRRFMIELKSGR